MSRKNLDDYLNQIDETLPQDYREAIAAGLAAEADPGVPERMFRTNLDLSMMLSRGEIIGPKVTLLGGVSYDVTRELQGERRAALDKVYELAHADFDRVLETEERTSTGNIRFTRVVPTDDNLLFEEVNWYGRTRVPATYMGGLIYAYRTDDGPEEA